MDSIIGYSVTGLMGQAHCTAYEYLKHGVEQIDSVLGEGYAKKNPQLLGDFMKVCAEDYSASLRGMCADRIADALGVVSDAIETLAPGEE